MHIRIAQGFLISAAVFLGHVPSVWAWTSANTALTVEVHQKAIDNVLGGLVRSGALKQADLDLLKSQQSASDAREYQAIEYSYMHSMTGVAADQTPENQLSVFIGLAETYVRKKLTSAVAARKAGDTLTAFRDLGLAMHPLEDATSPSHSPFQPWYAKEGVWDMAVHVFHERAYPDAGSENRIRLEGSVRWAYDMFLEKATTPAHFYDAAGNLLLPPNYQGK